MFSALRCLAVCANQKMCGDRAEQDGGLDVLLVGVALGDSGMLYDSSFRHFYQSEKMLMRAEREQQRECASCICVM